MASRGAVEAELQGYVMGSMTPPPPRGFVSSVKSGEGNRESYGTTKATGLADMRLTAPDSLGPQRTR